MACIRWLSGLDRLAGDEDTEDKADESEHQQHRESNREGPARGQPDGHQHGAGDRRAEGGTQVGGAAGEPRDLPLVLFGEARLHDVDRRRQHGPDADAQARGRGRT